MRDGPRPRRARLSPACLPDALSGESCSFLPTKLVGGWRAGGWASARLEQRQGKGGQERAGHTSAALVLQGPRERGASF